MRKLQKWASHYPLSIACFVLIWYLSLLFMPPETELNDVPFIDKWVHTAMYGGTCSILWLEYWRCHATPNRRRLFLLAWLAPILMSGLLELLQEYCTGGRRNGDWLDLAANSIGVTLAALAGIALWKYLHKPGQRP